jgi:hypothetical protein
LLLCGNFTIVEYTYGYNDTFHVWNNLMDIIAINVHLSKHLVCLFIAGTRFAISTTHD